MSKFTEGMKNWKETHPKTIRVGKAFGTAILKGLLYSANEQISAPPPPPAPGETEILDAEQIQQLYYMSTPQLKALFAGRKVAFATDKDAIAALYYLSTAQINAILGKE